MTTLFMLQANTTARHGSITVKPVCLWADTVVSECT